MSNKSKSGTTKESGKRELKPKLQFPEFRDDWVTKKIGDMLIESPRPIALNDEDEYSLVTVKRRYGGVVLRGVLKGKEIKVKTQFLVEEDDFLISKRQIVHNACGLVPKALAQSVVSNEYSVLTAQDGCDISFFDRFAQQPSVSESFLQSSVGIVIEKMLFKLDDWLKREFLFPSPAEQEKIAECLSSLDELIAAHSRKLDALKAHKKGLMQQLFPREGETLPRLRFPDFKGAPEWEDRELGPLTKKVGSGITPRGGNKNYKTEGRPFVRSQNVGWGVLILDDVVFIDEETHRSFGASEIKKTDVLLNITGASIGRSAVADKRVVGGNVNQHVCIIRVTSTELNAVFLNQYLISQNGQKQIDSFQAGGNRQGLNFGQIRSFLIPVPPTDREQIRIADCLSSVDDLVTTQSEKLDALKTHKKGLLQQLFPSLEDAK